MVGSGLPEKGKSPCRVGMEGGSVKGVLILLLALGVCFSYFYFFTDVMRPTEETPTQLDVSSTEERKPLPARAVQNGATSAARTGNGAPAPLPEPTERTAVSDRAQGGDAAKAPPTSPAVPPVPAATVARPVLPPQRTPAVPVEPAPPAGQKDTAKKAAAPEKRTTAAGKSSPPAAAATSIEKTGREKHAVKDGGALLPGKKKAGSEGKHGSVSTVQPKPATAGQGHGMTDTVAEGSEKTLSQKGGKGFSLVIGTYVLQSTLKADTSRLEKAGFHPTVVSGPKMSRPMNRLVVGEFGSYTTARKELEKVKKASKGAFLLQENGTFTLFAGSYFRKERAVEEQERLRTHGFVPILKQADVPVGSWKLMIGGIPTREAAQKEAARLRTMGFKPYPAP